MTARLEVAIRMAADTYGASAAQTRANNALWNLTSQIRDLVRNRHMISDKDKLDRVFELIESAEKESLDR